MNILIETYAQELIPLYSDKNEREQVIWWMLQSITGKTSAHLLAGDYNITLGQEQTLQRWIIEHVKNHKPLQYLIGSVPFADCTILVEPPILIPRPETEEWICTLIAKLEKVPHKKITILDLCTGSGALACAIAKKIPEAILYATDISEHALLLAHKNAVFNELTTITFIKSDLFDALQNLTFDLIVANPPYLSEQEWHELDPMVKSWEDYQALVANHNGLGLIEKIIEHAGSKLIRNEQLLHHLDGQLYIEIGYQQGQAAQNCMKKYFSYSAILKDYAHKDRVVVGGLRACGTQETELLS